MFFCIFSFVMMIWLIVKTLIFGNAVSGYPTIVTVILFMSGLQLLMFGVLGQYISRSYMEGKHRPIYIAREKKVKKNADRSAEGERGGRRFTAEKKEEEAAEEK